MAKQKQEVTLNENPENRTTVISGFRIMATIAEGWRTTFIDQDRLMLVHPDFPPRIVEMRSIKEGDVLPREDDTVVAPPPGLTA